MKKDGSTANSSPMHSEGRWSAVVILVCLVIHFALSVVLLTGSFGIDPALGSDSALAHFLLFFAPSLGLSTLLLGFVSLRRTIILMIGAALLGAVLTEAVQFFFRPGRSAAWADVAVDLMGTTAAIVVAVALRGDDNDRHIGRGWVALASLVAVASLGGLIVATAPSTIEWRNCRDADGAASLVEVVPGQPSSGEDRRSFYCEVQRTDSFEIVAVVQSADLTQEGPTRIATSSVGASADQFNVHIGQQGSQASIRIRTAEGIERLFVDNVFPDTSRVELRLRYDRGRLTFTRNGQIKLDFAIGEGAPGLWDTSFPLLAGDEFDGDRLFIGTIERVQFHAPAEAR